MTRGRDVIWAILAATASEGAIIVRMLKAASASQRVPSPYTGSLGQFTSRL